MSTVELKKKLKEKIEALNEDYLLEHLLGIIEFETSNDDTEIPKSHQKSIDIGFAQIKSGQTISNDVVMGRVKKWSER